MISQVEQTDGKTRSTGENWRMILAADGSVRSMVKGSANSMTYTMRKITEIPLAMLPDTVQEEPETVDGFLAEYVLEGDLTADEIAAINSVFPAYETGKAYIQDDIFNYGDTLYKVNQDHTSQYDWAPESTPALYSKTFAAEVIPIWFQPAGAHDAWALGAKVQWPEGTVWESTIPANTTEPGTLLPWGYWILVEE